MLDAPRAAAILSPMTRSHTNAVELPIVPELAFDLLIRPSAIRAWWSAQRAIVIPRTGGTWAASWGTDEDDPDYVTVARIADFERPKRLVLDRYAYSAKSGPLPFEADFVVTFAIEPSPRGSLLRVEQVGFPTGKAADEYLAACETGWTATLAAIARLAQQLPRGSRS
jgi:uncharacterized protein YndB with AHSA1/START domain